MTDTHPHRRYDPLRDRWVLVSPQRSQRPWQGQQEPAANREPEYVADCYLCPGNQRAGGQQNPDYEGVYAFDNDFPALLPATSAETDATPLFRSSPVRGRCRVLCYSPQHNLTLAQMSEAQIIDVVDCWAAETAVLARDYEHVQVFENRGATMGCSNAHPHGQIWAMDTQPGEIVTEGRQQEHYLATHGSRLLLDYALQERERGERTIVCNNAWIAVVPWWATWPFETLVIPFDPVDTLPDLDTWQRQQLAQLLKQLLSAYDTLFAVPFPYSMGWHGKPRSERRSQWQLHAHFYPPLLRSATVRKHMVGFEMLADAQRDLTPEQAAARLREVMA
jgi:UDPglucose--hexose-1-phosphate uridylyltransferase